MEGKGRTGHNLGVLGLQREKSGNLRTSVVPVKKVSILSY